MCVYVGEKKNLQRNQKGSGKLSNSILYQSLILYDCNNKWANSFKTIE